MPNRPVMMLPRRGLPGLLATPALAQPRALRLMLDWVPQGYHSAWFLAAERGYFAREGLNVTLIRGFGSADVITRVGAGAAEVGFGDPGAMVKFNAENPSRAVVNVFQYFDRTLAAVITLNGRGVERPADLRGKRIAAPPGDSGRVLFPAFAQANGFPADSVTWVNVAPPLREPMLFRGEAEAITAFTSGAFFALRTLGSPPGDIRMFRYNDHGVDIYGNGLVVPEVLANAEPELMRALVRVTVQGIRDVLADPAAAIAAVRAREALSDPALEDERMRFIFREAVLTPAVAANGVGHVEPAKAQAMMRIAARAFDVPAVPEWPRLMRTEFLPPAADRMLPAMRA